MIGNLRVRLTAAAGVVVATTLVGAGVLMVGIVEREARHSAVAAVERTLAETATASGPVGVRSDARIAVGDGVDFGVFRRDGDLAFGSMYFDDTEVAIVEINLKTQQINEIQDPVTEQRVVDPDVIEAADRLLLATRELDGIDTDRVLVGAVDPASIDVSTEAAQRALWIILPPVLALVMWFTWLLVGRALAPVVAITDRAQQISTKNLDERVPVPDSSDEIGRLATTINSMLDRLEDGDRRQRQFSGDVSHELRSPLSVVRAAGDVLVQHPERAPVLAPEIVAGADRLERIIDDLLSLAALDHSTPPMEDGIDVVAVVNETVLDRCGVAASQPGAPRVEVIAPVSVVHRANEAQLRRAVDNLVVNAVRHARGVVRVSVESSPDGCTIAVEDDGPGIAPTDRDVVFERFTRLDEARSRADGGAGLGLALVKAIVETHGGAVELNKSVSLGGARFSIVLPRRSEPMTSPSRHLRTAEVAVSDEAIVSTPLAMPNGGRSSPASVSGGSK